MAKKSTKNQDDRQWREDQMRFYGSIQWKELREAVMAERHGLCEECLKDGIIKSASVVHHITPTSPENINDPSIVLNKSNLVCLCERHHRLAHSKTKRYYFTHNDELVLL